jgi:hypothetical protein
VIDLNAARRRRAKQVQRAPMRAGERQGAKQPDFRARQNAAAGLVILALIVFGVWLFFELRTAVRTELCIEAGLRDCDAIAHRSGR